MPFGLVAAAAIAATVVAPLLAPLEARSQDVRLRMRSPAPDARVVAVPVDASALARYGRFPWESHVVPEALAALHSAGATGVVFDFPIEQQALAISPEETRGMTDVEAAEYLLRRAHISHATTIERLRALATREVSASDAAALLARFMPAEDLSLTPARVPTVLAFSAARAEEELLAAPDQAVRERRFLDRAGLPPAAFAGVTLPELFAVDLPADDQSDSFGVADLRPERDGVVRFHAPVQRYGASVLPSLPLAGALRHLGIDPATIRVEDRRLVLSETISLPLDDEGRLLIPWASRDELPTVSFVDLLEHHEEARVREALAGSLAIVHIAASRAGMPTALGPMPPGRVQAHIARALVSGDAIVLASSRVAWAWLGTIALVLLASGAFLGTSRLVPASLLLAVLHVGGAVLVVRTSGVLVPAVAPLAFIAVGGIALVWSGARVAEAERRRLDTLLADLRGATDDADLRGRLERLELEVERTPIRLGPYRLTGLIERGGMGAVFRAVDESLQRPVAVKIVADAEGEMRERFRREAELVARISHPNVVQVYGVGEHGGVPYFAMELVDGESLARKLVADGPMEPVAALRLAAQIARGLHAAHEHGIVHRDVKPSNVLLFQGTAKIVDFGVAKSGESGLTGTGAILGTADYMSPEQAQGLPLDHRSDLYSLGVTLFRMLAGSLPFSGESAVGVIYQHVHLPAPDLRDARPDLAPEIGELLASMLQKQAMNRPKDAASVAERLDALAADLVARARHAS